jgi:DNA-binding NarL/FixJ family response regulator
MPELNGLDAIRQIKARGFSGAVVLLSSHDERRFVAEALEIGVLAYVHKDDAFDRLIEAVQAALRGERWLSPRLAGSSDGASGQTLSHLLSPREREVLQLLAEGHNTKEAAGKLGISAKTIEYHRLSLFAKLRAKGIADLVRIAVKEGLVEL